MFYNYHTVITYFNYAAYRSAVAEGVRDIRFVSLLDHRIKSRNPVTPDKGMGRDAFIGVAGCSI